MSNLFSQLAATPSFADLYERHLVAPLFLPWIPQLFDRVELAPADRVLDVACGTGIVAREARRRQDMAGHAVGVDVNEQMIAVARAIEPEIDWRVGDAAALPIAANESFDVVLCQQGMQFFPDKPAAAREMRRALAPGGRVAVSAWSALDEAPFVRALYDVAVRQFGPFTDRRHSYHDANALQQLLADAGFRDVHVETVTRAIRFDDPHTFLRLNAMAFVGMSDGGAAMTPEQRTAATDALVAASAAVMRRYVHAGNLVFEIATNLAVARV
jgi:ubiquinone/menaquinone biosynthesis C-methylase UbiE